MFQTKVVEKIKIHILCSITFFQKSCRLWDNVRKYGTARQATDYNITQRMRFACWITKATDTHSEYVILIAFPHQQWLRERAFMLRYPTLRVLSLLELFLQANTLKRRLIHHRLSHLTKKNQKSLYRSPTLHSILGHRDTTLQKPWNAVWCQSTHFLPNSFQFLIR
jgi:hypothetical protein